MPKGNHVLSFIACGRGVAKKQNSWYVVRNETCHFSDALRINAVKAMYFQNLKLLPSKRRLHLWLIRHNSSDYVRLRKQTLKVCILMLQKPDHSLVSVWRTKGKQLQGLKDGRKLTCTESFHPSAGWALLWPHLADSTWSPGK